MAMSRERRQFIIDQTRKMSEKEQIDMFMSVQILLNAKHKCRADDSIFTQEQVDDMYDELPEIKEILASMVMICQTDLTTMTLAKVRENNEKN